MARLELRDWIALAGAGVGLALLLRQLRATPAAAAAPSGIGFMTRHEVQALAERTVSEHNLAAAVGMLVAMASIESSFQPQVIGDDGTSFGLLQVSRSTATWLAGDMGYSAFGRTLADSDLLRPEVSMYLGAAYVDWLSRYRGVLRTEEWIVRAYNGGPQWDSRGATVLANTARHWSRYLAAKQSLGFS